LKTELIIAGLLTIHLLIAWPTHYFINKTDRLNESQKSNYFLLIWCIPILWSLFVRVKFMKKEIDVMTKDKRKRNSGTNSDNWMGITGGGSDSSYYSITKQKLVDIKMASIHKVLSRVSNTVPISYFKKLKRIRLAGLRSVLIPTHAVRIVIAYGKTAQLNVKIRQFDSFID
jgi:hypothetical protein